MRNILKIKLSIEIDPFENDLNDLLKIKRRYLLTPLHIRQELVEIELLLPSFLAAVIIVYV